jgi:hypothetical protein
MTAQKAKLQPWFRVTTDLRKDGPFFGVIGLICGFVQIVGYHYFDKAEWGSELLQEHIPFNSLLLMAMLLWLARGLTGWLTMRWTMRCTKALILIEHVAGRVVAFGSVAAWVVIGFAISVAISGAYVYAIIFAVAAMYFVAIAEVAANPLPLRQAELSKGYDLALLMVIVTPFMFSMF